MVKIMNGRTMSRRKFLMGRCDAPPGSSCRPSAPTARSTRLGSTSKQTNTPQSAFPQRKLRAISAKPATGRFKIGNQRRRIQIVVAFVLVMLIGISPKVIGLQLQAAMRAPKQQINGPEQEQLSLTEARFSIVMVKNCRVDSCGDHQH